MDLMKKQLELEEAMLYNGGQKFDELVARAAREGNKADLGAQRGVMSKLMDPLIDALEWAEKEAFTPGKRPARAAGVRLVSFYSGAYNMVAYLTLRTMFNMMGSFVVTTADVIGSSLEDQLRFAQTAAAAPKYMEKVMDNINKQRHMRVDRKRKILAAADRKIHADKQWIDWTASERESVGLHCLHAALVSTSAFTVENGVIQPTGELLNWLTEDTAALRELAAGMGPCVVPPRPWVSPSEGGYHSPKVSRLAPLVRHTMSEYLRKLHSPEVIRHMAPFYKAINIVQNTGWHINPHILGLAREIRKRNLALWDIPDAQAEGFKYPAFNADKRHVKVMVTEEGMARAVYPGDAAYDLKGLRFLDDKVQAEFLLWKKGKREYMNKRICDDGKLHKVLLTLSTADTYAEYASIYFAFHADTRGRIYPYSALLSPQGCDLEKALLEFDTEFPLDLKFLKLQLTGLYGFDKSPYKERLAWCDENHAALMAVGADPLDSSVREFITAADSPFQFIAAARGYYEHHTHGKTTTRLWWAQDGACNGLQHFSMMLKDEVGGALVNLVKNDKPSDIYQHVADMTIAALEDCKEGTEECPQASKFYEVAHKVGISRKLTKRPTMIKPYSGTAMGALVYVKDFYHEWDEKNQYALTAMLGENKQKFMLYMNKPIWSSVESSVPKATEGMSWLKTVGRRIGTLGKGITWVVPGTGFLAFQKKMDTTRVKVSSIMFGTLTTNSNRNTLEVAASAMGNSMAPNFVHSLDSAHMLTTVLAAAEQGVTHFALVHDSYGVPTHQSNTMAYLIRDSFYHLYADEDVLVDFMHQQHAAHPSVEFPALPEYGSLNRNEVYNAAYLFS